MKLRVALLALMLLLGSPFASPQCSMCAQGTSNTNQATQRAIKRGVILLAIPPIGIMVAFIGLAVRNGRKPQD